MNVISSYKVKILHYNHIFDETVSYYQKAVDFFLHAYEQELTDIETLKLKERNHYMERLFIRTKRNTSVMRRSFALADMSVHKKINNIQIDTKA